MSETQGSTGRASGSDSYVVFELAGGTYAIRSDDIQQLDMVGVPTPVPHAPSYVEGVVSIRGTVIPAINLRKRFGFAAVPHDPRTRLIVVRALGRIVGLIVDSAREFASIPSDAIVPLPEGIADTTGRYLRGVAHRGERLMLMVDLAELLANDAVDADPAPDEAALEPLAAGASK